MSYRERSIEVFGVRIPPWLKDGLGIVMGIVEFLMQLLGFGTPNLKPITDAINNTWANLLNGATFLYNAVGVLRAFVVNFITILVKAIEHILTDIIHGHLLALIHDIQALFKSLKELFQPILNLIDRLRKLYYQYIYKWVKLVQEILSTVRVILSAFKLLGAQWAAKLDADIARIQGYITQFMQAIVGTLNQASTWLNFAVDPLGIMRRDFFNNTLMTSAAGLERALNIGKDRGLTASETANTDGDRAMLKGGAAVLTRNSDGSVTFSDASKRINTNLDAAWNSYGPPHTPN
jgi:phage-related protein